MAKARSSSKPAASSGKGAAAASVDPALAAFEKALSALRDEDWARAAKLFGEVLEQADRSDLEDRARQYLAVCQRHLEKGAPQEGDPFLRAVFEKNRGDLDAVLALCRENGRDQKDDRFAYLIASVQALQGQTDEAVQSLSRAIELNPKNRVHAYHDSDFSELRRNSQHRHLFGLS
jgi:tetratricopeptide (TPR) repeat protein